MNKNEIKSISLALIALGLSIPVGLILRYNPKALEYLAINATTLDLVGDIFIRLLKLIAPPIIFFSLLNTLLINHASGTSHKLMTYTILVYLLLSLISVVIAIACSDLVDYTKVSVKSLIRELKRGDSGQAATTFLQDAATQSKSVRDIVINMIPTSVLTAFASYNFIQTSVLSVLFAITIIRMQEKEQILTTVTIFYKILLKLADFILKFSPLAIFALTTWLISFQSPRTLRALGKFMMINIGCYTLLTMVIYPLVVFLVGKRNPFEVYRQMWKSLVISGLLSSTLAVVGSATRDCTDKLKISSNIANFTWPIGAILGMHAAVLYIMLAASFCANLYGITLTLNQHIVLAGISCLAALGVGVVPSGSLFALISVLALFKIPLDFVAVLLSVDRIVSMMRTVANVSGNTAATIVVAKFLDKQETSI